MVSQGFAAFGYQSIHMDDCEFDGGYQPIHSDLAPSQCADTSLNAPRGGARPTLIPTLIPATGWEEKTPPRDPTTHQLRADTKRFPSGAWRCAAGAVLLLTRPGLRGTPC